MASPEGVKVQKNWEKQSLSDADRSHSKSNQGAILDNGDDSPKSLLSMGVDPGGLTRTVDRNAAVFLGVHQGFIQRSIQVSPITWAFLTNKFIELGPQRKTWQKQNKAKQKKQDLTKGSRQAQIRCQSGGRPSPRRDYPTQGATMARFEH